MDEPTSEAREKAAQAQIRMNATKAMPDDEWYGLTAEQIGDVGRAFFEDAKTVVTYMEKYGRRP